MDETNRHDETRRAFLRQCAGNVVEAYAAAAARGHADAIIIACDLNDPWAAEQARNLQPPEGWTKGGRPLALRDGVTVVAVADAEAANLAKSLGPDHTDFRQPPAGHYRVLVLAAGGAVFVLAPIEQTLPARPSP